MMRTRIYPILCALLGVAVLVVYGQVIGHAVFAHRGFGVMDARLAVPVVELDLVEELKRATA